MSSLNRVQLIGHLGKDPESRFLPSGEAVANISIATSESWKDKTSGEKQERTEWHRLAFFGKLAEIVSQYLKKGSQVYVEGSLQTRKWTDKSGAEKFTTEIRADRLVMLGKADGAERSEPERQKPAQKASAQKNIDDFEDDIPF